MRDRGMMSRYCRLRWLGLVASWIVLGFSDALGWAASAPESLPPPADTILAAPMPSRSMSPSRNCIQPQSATTDLPFQGMSELSVEALVHQVLARNPTLAQMIAAWQAAQARYPQVTSLDDPMLGVTTAPAAIGQLTDGNRGYRLEISQKLPWPGKLALRGQNALAEVGAARNEVEDTRLKLVEAAKEAFYQYYLVDRELAVNAEALRLLRDFRKNAAARFETGLVPEQDVLQADVEIGQQNERQITLEETRQVAIARLNTLLHLPPNDSLPPPPRELHLERPLPEASILHSAALARRPDLLALADRIRADQAALGLAWKDFKPDFEVTAAYDAFWQEHQLQPMIGVRLNLPVRQARRYGAVAESEAHLAQRRAELAKLVDQVNFQVQEAYEQVHKSERVVHLYQDTILKAARANVQAAQSAYVTGKTSFLTLIEAERSRVNLEERFYQALTEYFRRRARLERAVGGPMPSATK